jgi:hypothetical protein
MNVECPQCRHKVPHTPDPRLSAWCPKCGADFDPPAAEADPAGAVPEPPTAVEQPAAATGTAWGCPLPYFHARLASGWSVDPTIFRVYLAGHDLLFINLGVTSLEAPDSSRPAAPAGGGLLVAAVAAVATQVAAAHAQATLDRLNHVLKLADEKVLREYAAEDEKSFVLSAEDVRDVRIDPSSVWGTLFGAKHSALLRFDHEARGDVTLQLISINDVSNALTELPRVFKNVAVNISWNSL